MQIMVKRVCSPDIGNLQPQIHMMGKITQNGVSFIKNYVWASPFKHVLKSCLTTNKLWNERISNILAVNCRIQACFAHRINVEMLSPILGTFCTFYLTNFVALTEQRIYAVWFHIWWPLGGIGLPIAWIAQILSVKSGWFEVWISIEYATVVFVLSLDNIRMQITEYITEHIASCIFVLFVLLHKIRWNKIMRVRSTPGI